MNMMKTLVAFLCSLVGLLFIQQQLIFKMDLALMLAFSGVIGLFLGDLFMLKAMREIGASRMVMMFGLTPFLTGLGSYFLFSANLSWAAWLGVLFMVLCLYLLSFENFKNSGDWQLKGLCLGLVAVLLDNIGLMITKYSFLHFSNLHSVQVNFHRALGALLAFVILQMFFKKIFLFKSFQKLSPTDRLKVLIGSVLGTFVSLLFYLQAVNLGHLSVVTSVACTGPLFAKIFECWQQGRWPHYLWWLAFSSMVIGFAFFSIS